MIFKSLHVVILAISSTIGPSESFVSSNRSGLGSNQNSKQRPPVFKPGLIPNQGDIPLLNRKVFQGYRVNVEEHPYIVSIRRNYAHYLVGTLLSKTLVVTVAHPLHNVPINELAVVAGEHYSDRGSTLLTVILLVVHQEFDPDTLINNIALLQLYEDPGHTYKVKPILGTWLKKDNYFGKTGFVTGWGRCDLMGNELCLPRSSLYYPDEYLDPMLKTVKILLTDNSAACSAYSAMEIPLASYSERTFCAGEARKEHPTAACLAVPGAPLVVEGYLLGLASWGFSCGYSDDLPLVYTDIRAYQTWIKTNMKASADVLTPATELKGIFETTKAYKLLKWIDRSRGHKKLRYGSLDPSLLQVTKEDQYVLIKFEGILTDVRDYIADGKFAAYKQEVMGMTKMVMHRQNNSDIQTPVASIRAQTEYIGLDPPIGNSSNPGTYGSHPTEVASYDYTQA